jgi:alpha-galactosidase
VPIRREHPEWFISADGVMAYPDLANPQAYAYTLSEISRLVEAYRLGWMKLDFNFDLGYDTTGTEHRLYMSAWHKLLGELRAKYPKMIFEACASGGLRNDLSIMKLTHGHFLSDSVSPFDALRIGEGAMLRLLPGRIGKWVAFRSAGTGIPKSGTPLAQAPEAIVTPNGATWDFKSSLTTTVDFVMVASMSGMMGLTGDPSSLGADARERIRQYIAFYKQWREFIAGSVAYLQNEPKPMNDRTGWSTVQLAHPTRRESLIFAARLIDGIGHRYIKLQGLEPDTSYVITDELGQILSSHTGRELMDIGLRVEVSMMHDARVRVVSPKP